MLRSADVAGIPWRLTYGGRQKSSMGFLTDLEQFGDKVDVVPQDRHGHPDLAAIDSALEPGGLIYSRGPEGLLNAVESACLAAGAQDFETPTPEIPGRQIVPPPGPGGPDDVGGRGADDFVDDAGLVADEAELVGHAHRHGDSGLLPEDGMLIPTMGPSIGPGGGERSTCVRRHVPFIVEGFERTSAPN